MLVLRDSGQLQSSGHDLRAHPLSGPAHWRDRADCDHRSIADQAIGKPEKSGNRKIWTNIDAFLRDSSEK